MRLFRRGFLSTLVILHGVFFMGSAQAETTVPPLNDGRQKTEAHYLVYLGGVKMVEGDIRLSLAAKAYRIDVLAESRGLLGFFYTWTTTLSSRGTWGGDRVYPASHLNHNQTKSKQRITRLTYMPDGKVQVYAEPPSKTDGRTPITAEDLLNTLDPVSAGVEIIQRLGRGEGCQTQLRIYDGRRRYNLNFEDKGMEAVESSSSGFFKGQAHRCDVTFHPIGGFKKKDRSDNFWSSAQDDREMPVIHTWFAAPLEGGPMMPVKIEADSDFGRAVIQVVGVNRL